MVQDSATGSVIHVRVIPRARTTTLAGTRQGALLVRLAAPPVDGAANAALVKFLAARLGIPANRVRIVSGESSREKRVGVEGLRAVEVLARLEPPLEG
ncbi:MAG: DUF167 domain-containing protein [Vicinamibacterales bacterium]